MLFSILFNLLLLFKILGVDFVFLVSFRLVFVWEVLIFDLFFKEFEIFNFCSFFFLSLSNFITSVFISFFVSFLESIIFSEIKIFSFFREYSVYAINPEVNTTPIKIQGSILFFFFFSFLLLTSFLSILLIG